MRKWIKISVWTLLLAAGITVCIVRWQAWFGMPDEPRWTGDTLSYTFRSPVFNNDSVLTFIVLGDIHSQLKQADYDTLAARVPNADAVAQVGDWLDRGQEYYHQLLLREWTPSALSDIPVIVCPGNHEYSKGFNKRLSPVWESTFPHPTTNRLESVPGMSYYIDYPALRFIVLDTNPLDHLVHLTRTLTWLRNAMNTADGRFVVVMMHHPVLPAGKGRFNPLLYATFRYALSEVDLVISGHEHSYQRAHNSFIVINTAGKPKQQQTLMPVNCAATEPVYGVMTVTPSTMHFSAYRLRDGELIDHIDVKHD